MNFHRLNPGQSYFDTLPPDLNKITVNYSTACQCNVNENEAGRVCINAFSAAFPTAMKKKFFSPMLLCDRDKRDVHFSDDPTEEDFQIFKNFPQLQPRVRRAAQFDQISKQNATRYCAERISETKIGKLCAKVGVNVQALVDACSADLVVSKQLTKLPRLVWVYMRCFTSFLSQHVYVSGRNIGDTHSNIHLCTFIYVYIFYLLMTKSIYYECWDILYVYLYGFAKTCSQNLTCH